MAAALSAQGLSSLSISKLSAVRPRATSAVRATSLARRNVSLQISASATKSQVEESVMAATLAGTFFSALASAPSAVAAQEIMALADADYRAGSLLVVLVPALGWVLFNILQPALNQLDKMGFELPSLKKTGAKKAFTAATKAKSFIAAAGLGAAASLMASPDAEAAQLVADLAADNRPYLLLLLLVAAAGWVLFNIFGPALNQINNMANSKKSVIGAVGLGALAGSTLFVDEASAAQEFATLAADARPAVLLVVLLPALGWVLFNILQPALNQLVKMGFELPSLPKRTAKASVTKKTIKK